MKKTYIFLLIIGLAILGRILFPIVVGLIKITFGLVVGLGVIALIALIWYVVHETSKHN
jgi:hypothetical protein